MIYAHRRKGGMDVLRRMSWTGRWALLIEGTMLIDKLVDEHGLWVS